jgi:hypothetical protein
VLFISSKPAALDYSINTIASVGHHRLGGSCSNTSFWRDLCLQAGDAPLLHSLCCFRYMFLLNAVTKRPKIGCILADEMGLGMAFYDDCNLVCPTSSIKVSYKPIERWILVGGTSCAQSIYLASARSHLFIPSDSLLSLFYRLQVGQRVWQMDRTSERAESSCDLKRRGRRRAIDSDLPTTHSSPLKTRTTRRTISLTVGCMNLYYCFLLCYCLFVYYSYIVPNPSNRWGSTDPATNNNCATRLSLRLHK